MKIKKSDLIKMIKEEMEVVKKKHISESKSTSTSDMEIEELLRAYARNAGGLPDNINKLSVLFPVLERAGLGEIVEDYMEIDAKYGSEDAMLFLDRLKGIVNKIKYPPASDDADFNQSFNDDGIPF